MSKRAGRPSPDNPTSGVMRRAVTKGRFAVRPGTFNLAGQFFTPDGGRLEKVVADVDVTEIRALVRRGATVAFEGCGCGGGGCTPAWPSPIDVHAAAAAAEPVFTGRQGTPTWADVWAVEGTRVVFLHGDVTWGSLLE